MFDPGHYLFREVNGFPSYRVIRTEFRAELSLACERKRISLHYTTEMNCQPMILYSRYVQLFTVSLSPKRKLKEARTKQAGMGAARRAQEHTHTEELFFLLFSIPTRYPVKSRFALASSYLMNISVHSTIYYHYHYHYY